MERVIAYIDGYNLYYGIRAKGWAWAKWLNVQAMCQRLLRPQQALVLTRYYTSLVRGPSDKVKRQTTFIEALQTLQGLSIHYGHFLNDSVVCWNCGHKHTCYHEKMTDVNIVTNLLVDAVQDRFDLALLVSADSDLIAPIRAIGALCPSKRVLPVFPPARFSAALRSECGASLHISRAILVNSLLPDTVTKADGYILQRPRRGARPTDIDSLYGTPSLCRTLMLPSTSRANPSAMASAGR